MSNEFKECVKETVKVIQQEVYIKDEVLQKIVGLFLSIKEGRFLGKKPPRGILFYGPPGTGKTLLMKTLAKKVGLSEPIMIRGPEIISQYYGKSESRLRQIFTLAKERAEEENLAIIFIDELDSLASRRDLTKGELESRLVGQLLSLMDGLEKEITKGHVAVIGSTNRPDVLDPALRRPGRFDLEIEFDPPSVDERKEIIKIILNNYANGRYSNINFDEIAEQTIGFTGADMLQLVNESLLQVVIEGRDYMTHNDLMSAKNSVKPSALREFNLAKPKDRTNEIENKDIVNNLSQIANEFYTSPYFKPILLSQPLPLPDKIASTIAYLVNDRLNCPYLVVSATCFRSRWFGEMERSIRLLFEKIKYLQPCVVYIKNIDAIADPADEHLRGAILELLEHLIELNDNNAKVLLLCSATGGVDSQVKIYLREL
ncbi:VCP-like ATPase [uncultured archaeon]|nr:VCP-like ATPase [uncultured archaeon]